MRIYFKIPSSRKIVIALTYIGAIIVCFFLMPKNCQKTYVFYISIISISLMFATLADLIVNSKYSNFFWTIAILLAGTVMAFRAQTAIDDIVYKNIFLSASGKGLMQYLFSRDIEKGYLLINYILYRMTGGNYNIAQVIICYLSFGIWGIAMKKYRLYCSYPILLLMLWTQYYFLIMGAGLVRIFIAIPIVLYALNYVWNENWKKYVLLIVIASCFHLSALIMLLMIVFALDQGNFYKHWILFVIFLTIIVPISFYFIAKFLVPMLGVRYAGYANINGLSITIDQFDVLPIWLLGLYYYGYIEEGERKRYIIGMILISISVIFSVCSSMVSIGRVIYYANLGLLITISKICKMKPQHKSDYFIGIILILYLMLYLMHTGFSNKSIIDNLFPYVSFWGKV